MDIESWLIDEAKDEIEQINDMELGSEQYRNSVDGITKLVDRAIEIKKMELENNRKIESQEVETVFKMKQLEDEKKNNWIGHGITIGVALMNVGVLVWGCKKSWKFEETGTVTNGPGREFMKRIFKK